MKSLPSADRLNAVLRYDGGDGQLYWRVRRGRQAAGSRAGRVTHGRLSIRVDGVEYFAHRLIWRMAYGTSPLHTVDHIDNDPLNNRLTNLRDVPLRTNAQNRRRPSKRNKTGFLGVHMCKGKYVALITVNGKVKRIGTFDDAQRAHAAYLQAKRELHPGNTL